MDEKLLSITQAAEILGVSLDTLRRWDKSGKLTAIRKDGGAHRYYLQKDLDVFASDLLKLAYDWTIDGLEIPSMFYCSNSAVFQARLIKMQDAFIRAGSPEEMYPLIVAVAGEIGNNSFDHNLGKWLDIPGVFFAYDISKHQVVLADRGLGILTTLGRVRPELKTHIDAMRVAFTEIVSGRAPEERGNGLKFVRQVVAKNPISLFFRTGDAELRLKKENSELFITRSATNTRGCLAVIKF
ncbi:MAG: MerR family transcriptional regulator [Candidatus Andersenbacteria bacterium]|nr:MerR family transcriptional regulator [Candidatus Andersenbacteria bacterium]